MRWAGETEEAAKHLGWTIVETNGLDDYQGWGVHLLKRDDEYAVMAWSYGSCSGCDSFEDQVYSHDGNYNYKEPTPERLAEIFGDLIEVVGSDESAARMKFDERKGW